MDEKERKGIIDSLYPVGGERWIKVKYLDQEKSMKSLSWNSSSPEPTENDRKRGFQMMAIGVKDEYIPQISALVDLKDDVIGKLSRVMELNNPLLSDINYIFREKIEELKSRVIMVEAPKI